MWRFGCPDLTQTKSAGKSHLAWHFNVISTFTADWLCMENVDGLADETAGSNENNAIDQLLVRLLSWDMTPCFSDECV